MVRFAFTVFSSLFDDIKTTIFVEQVSIHVWEHWMCVHLCQYPMSPWRSVCSSPASLGRRYADGLSMHSCALTPIPPHLPHTYPFHTCSWPQSWVYQCISMRPLRRRSTASLSLRSEQESMKDFLRRSVFIDPHMQILLTGHHYRAVAATSYPYPPTSAHMLGNNSRV